MLLTLMLSADFVVSNLLKSAAVLGFSVPPWMVSRATWVKAVDLGTRGHEPYQLRVLWACFGDLLPVPVDLLSFVPSPAPIGRSVVDLVVPRLTDGARIEAVEDAVVDVDLDATRFGALGRTGDTWEDDCDGDGIFVWGKLGRLEGLAVLSSSAGFGFARLRGPMSRGWKRDP